MHEDSLKLIVLIDLEMDGLGSYLQNFASTLFGSSPLGLPNRSDHTHIPVHTQGRSEGGG